VVIESLHATHDVSIMKIPEISRPRQRFTPQIVSDFSDAAGDE
jgi:hypothetical protein